MGSRSLFRLSAMLALTVGVLGAACTSQSAAPAAPDAPAKPPAASTAAPAPTTGGSAAAAPPATPAGAATSPSGLRFTFAPGQSEARYRAREQFANATLFTEAVGSTSAVGGQIVVDAANKIVPDASRVIVNLTSLQSDQQQRDNYLQRTTLQTAQHPNIELVPTEVRGLATPLPSAGPVTFQLLGDMILRGVTHPTVWDVQAQLAGSEVSGTATTQFTLADFNIPKPSVARVLSIQDTIRLELDFRGTTSAAP
jgi:polyisoprenoid-binding protein YceI